MATDSECHQRVLSADSPGDQLQYRMQMLCDSWVVVSCCERFELGEQLRDVLLVKDRGRFMVDETKVRNIEAVEVREKSLDAALLPLRTRIAA